MKLSEMWEGPNSSLNRLMTDIRKEEIEEKTRKIELLGTILDGNISEARRLQVVERMKDLWKQIKRLKK